MVYLHFDTVMIERFRRHQYDKEARRQVREGRRIKIVVWEAPTEEGQCMDGQTPQQMAQTIVTEAQTLEAALSAQQPTAADNVLSAVVSAVNTAGLVQVFGADALTSALQAAGYTVTAPESTTTSAGTGTDTTPPQ